MNRLAVTLCGIILAALPSASALADTIYTYTGNGFNVLYGSAPQLYTTSDFVSGSFTVSAPLAPNLSFGQISVGSATLMDGVQTLSSALIPSSNVVVEVATDSNGNIDAWLVSLWTVDRTNPLNPFVNAQIDTGNFSGVVEDEAYVNGNAQGAKTIQDPGTWTVSTTDSPSPVPEPSSLFLLGTGAIGGLGVFRRKLVGQTLAGPSAMHEACSGSIKCS